MHLVTTADESTWSYNETNLFLGGWCKRYSQRNVWKNIDHITVKYHWDDRIKLQNDYHYLQELYERILLTISDALNNIHNVNYPTRYWRIVAGSWLNYFIHILFDRWSMIEYAFNQYPIESTEFSEVSIKPIIPKDMEEFVSLMGSDIWNQSIYSEILEFKDFDVVKVNTTKVHNIDANSLGNNWKKIIKSPLKSIVTAFLRGLSKNNHFFLYSTNYSLLDQWRLEIALGNYPSYNPKIEVNSTDKNTKRRSDLNIKFAPRNDFEKFVIKMIPSHIPGSYMEYYDAILKNTRKVKWPNKPKIIATAIAYSSDDFFKVWMAGKVIDGSKLVILQHGGNYGVSKWSGHEEHQYKIATFLSWGWKSVENQSILPSPSGKLSSISKKLTYNPSGGLVQVLLGLQRYSVHLHATIIASQFMEYQKDQIKFAQLLDDRVFSLLKVRLYTHDFGWDYSQYWKDKVPDVKFSDNSIDSMYDAIQKSRLFIGTYNATGILEAMSANIPTIIFWNPKYWEMNSIAQSYYDNLRSVGILHDTPESAAEQVNLIWENVSLWWERDDVQSVRKRFCDQYASTSRDWVRETVSIFKEISP